MIGDLEDLKVEEALKGENWKSAMNEEYEFLTKNKTWTLVDLTENDKPLSCKFSE